jgi:signal transduction histidine kinase
MTPGARTAKRSLNAAAASWVSLMLLALLTVAAWRATDHYVYARIEERFQSDAKQTAGEIEQRLQEYRLALRAVAGLFKATGGEVTAAQWKNFINDLALEKHFPGVHGIGYAKLLTLNEVPAHVARLRADGFDDYALRPAGERALYAPITYLSVYDDPPPVGFGFDMLSEPVRRAAMEKARDSGDAVVSGSVLQPPDSPNPRRGVLLYQPIFRAGAPTDTVEQRQEALQGFVFSPLRLENLLHNIQHPAQRNIRVELLDADDRSAVGPLLVDPGSHTAAEETGGNGPQFSVALPLQAAERTWLMYARAGEFYALPTETYLPLLIAVVGGVIDILLFIVINSLLTQRRRAEDLAQEMTAELQRKNRDLEQFANVLAHHLQEPVRLIYVFAQRLAKIMGGEKSDDVALCLDTILAAATRERALLRDVQLYLSVGQEHADSRSSVKQSAETASRHLSASVVRTGAEVIIDDGPEVAVPGNQLLELFMALIGNALVHTCPDRPPKIHITVRSLNPAWVEVTVADNGPGVAEANRERVFKIFEHLTGVAAPPNDKRHSSGNGIGLALARRVVEAVGGRIRIESSLMGGAAVRFTLPISKARTKETNC